MKDLVPKNREDDDFRRDLKIVWQHDPINECPWSTTIEHLNELFDLYNVGEVKNVLCLRLFAQSIFEVANSPVDSPKLMHTIFGERLINQVANYDQQVYEAIGHTTQYMAWKIRKAQIINFRRTSEEHTWKSVRKIMIDVLKNSEISENVIAGMTAAILEEVVRGDRLTWAEDGPLLRRDRFPHVFRVAFRLFNDAIGERLRKKRAEVVYEALAARLVTFYCRLAADTWRILILRNGPKVEVEHFLYRNVEVKMPKVLIQSQPPTSNSNSSNNNEKSVDAARFTNQRPLSRPMKREHDVY
ncbi:unnamed protein product [Caenorhabditis sp. 36 PRJEB53466]|nr:unnamed protein product [Caenorhabditis sp. 36 PRJEB53466]